MYVPLRAWRANEGGTTDLPDYSETVHCYRPLFETKLQIYTAPRNGTYILLGAVFLTARLHFVALIKKFYSPQSAAYDLKRSYQNLVAFCLQCLFQ